MLISIPRTAYILDSERVNQSYLRVDKHQPKQLCFFPYAPSENGSAVPQKRVDPPEKNGKPNFRKEQTVFKTLFLTSFGR